MYTPSIPCLIFMELIILILRSFCYCPLKLYDVNDRFSTQSTYFEEFLEIILFEKKNTSFSRHGYSSPVLEFP